jgi:hypothetical protein
MNVAGIAFTSGAVFVASGFLFTLLFAACYLMGEGHNA